MRYAPFMALALAAPAAAQDRPATGNALPETATSLRELVQCRSIAESAERLSCYDRQVAAIEQQTTSGDLIVTDKAAVSEARRGLFGFKLPSIKLFGSGDESSDQLDARLRSVRGLAYGAWRFTLEDGAIWEQTDGNTLAVDPRVGSTIRIRKGAFGSFMANVDGQRAVRVRRVE